jgi:hypothetical protein
LYVTTQRYDNILREFNEIKGNIDVSNGIDSQTINSELNVDITKKIEQSQDRRNPRLHQAVAWLNL